MLTITCALFCLNTWAKDNAVILLYHHVSHATPTVTSVSPVTFRQHMQYLADNHQVLPLKDVIDALQNKQPLPDKTVVITFDDGYENIFTNAHPIIQEFSFPYTVFVNPPLIGNMASQLDWHQVTQMAAEGATFANHGKQHQHMLDTNAEESQQEWLDRVTDDIQAAEKMLAQHIGYSLKYLAFPYGEFDKSLKLHLRSLGYIGFAQHSGAIASFSDFSALPRFPAAGAYSEMNSLRVKLSSLSMPVNGVVPDEPKIRLPFSDKQLRLTVNSTDLIPRQINCFQNGQTLSKTINGKTIYVDISPITQPGRHRINCTAPSLGEKDRFYWFSQPFFAPTAAGEWLD
ncbi:polysaccharide deacetylase family protein [uncultured Paraglaciecola sp.]|uniref:polysaccharide deacetylase family protein n=1 Tax=uncultured Paraglaciecola sp. TaxID=1765024 RepID=UPI002616E0DC|nr:polysaccharide deacetylase family protein [uncultured Paraglaciecola sp.]